MSSQLVFSNCRVTLRQERWRVRIEITAEDSTEHVFYADADRYYTDGDGIWFGSEKDHEEWDG